ncbi:MAG: HD domain-containing protein, partial [Victivallaceae bacterium]
EEGRLLYSATSDLLKKNHLFPSKQALFFFIGTGSLIVMFTNHGRLQFSECSAFGSIRILDEFGGMGIRPQRMADLLKSMELKERLAHMANFDCHSPVEVIGVGAGLRSGEMLAEFTRCGNGQVRFLETTSFDELCRTLKSFTPLELEEKLNIVDHLAVNMVSSFAIAEYFVNEFSASRLLLPWLSTRSALVTNLLNPELEQEFRNDLLSAVENIGDKYNFDRRHAALVTNVAMKIFDKLKVHFQLNERDRIILECGAMLHDVGRFVDIRQHHKHSFYLISNSNLPGLSGRDLHLVAAIARYHRKSAPKNGQIEFDRCSVADRVVLQKLAAILRVADSLVRGETDKYLKLSIHLIDGALVFRNPGSVDTLLESVYLAKKGDLFREVFGLKLKFEEDLKRS